MFHCKRSHQFLFPWRMVALCLLRPALRQCKKCYCMTTKRHAGVSEILNACKTACTCPFPKDCTILPTHNIYGSSSILSQHMALTWLQISRSAKPVSCFPVFRIVRVFILTFLLYTGIPIPVHSTQSAKHQGAESAAVSKSANTGNAAEQDSLTTTKRLIDKAEVLSIRELLMLFIALVGWVLFAYSRKKISSDEATKRRAQIDVDKQEEKKLQKNDYDRYQDMLKLELGYISLPGLKDAKKNIAINLNDDTFVPLRFSGNTEIGNPPDEIMKQAFHKGRRVRMLLVIGEPGAGKTTLLKYYALCARETCNRLGFSGSISVFYLPLRDLVRSENGTYDSLQANLSNWSKKHHQYVTAELFDEWLNSNTSLILLDGLDEISNTTERKEVCTWIDNAWRGIGKTSYFVVTSRLTGYNKDEGVELEAEYERADVQDFTTEQQKQFLTNWFAAALLKEPCEKGFEEVEWQEKQKAEARELTVTMIAHLNSAKNKELRKLAAIPMILQIMAILWKERDYMPKSRVKLYDAVLDYLLEIRDEKKELKPLILASDARVVLCPVSFWMQAELLSDKAEKNEMHKQMQPLLDTLDNPPSVAKFCDYMIKRTSLFVTYGNDYGFKHKTFREYFASVELVKKVLRNPDELDTVVSAFGQDWWDEPIKFFIAQGDGEIFNLFMEKLINSPLSETLTQKQKILLQTLIEEAPQKKINALCIKLCDPTNSASRQRAILDCLKAIAKPAAINALKEFKTRELAKNKDVAGCADDVIYALQELKDKTEQSDNEEKAVSITITLPVINLAHRPASFRNQHEHNAEYILIPGGSYLYSETKKEKQVIELYFAKNPVTNKRYRSFIAALGKSSELIEKLNEIAQNNKWDTQLAPWLKKGKNNLAALFRSTYDEDRKFGGDDQPVIGITWYAAQAYGFWLSQLEGKPDSYRLPNEVEWQWAAGGIQGTTVREVREYPWPSDKGEPNSKLLNYNGNVVSTTPVGIYPEGATPEGLYDIAGNVWEWTDSWWDEQTPSLRVIRGGSWNSPAERCLSNYNLSTAPSDFMGSDVGFRVVFVP